MTYIHCGCGLAKEQPKPGLHLCEHCDQPCGRRGCDQCATLTRTIR